MDSSAQDDTPAVRESRLLLLVVDPYQIHAYWEAAPSRIAAAIRQAGEGARAVLRFYDLGKMGGWFDIEIRPESKSWYVHLWTPGRSYTAELGVRGVEGQFVRILQSNIVHLPRAWPVVAVEERFARVEIPRVESPIEADSAGTKHVTPAETTTKQTTKATPPQLPKHIDSTQVLKEKLTRIDSLGGLPLDSLKAEKAPSPAVASPRLETGEDLTAAAEKAFTNPPSSGS